MPFFEKVDYFEITVFFSNKLFLVTVSQSPKSQNLRSFYKITRKADDGYKHNHAHMQRYSQTQQ